MAEFVEAVAEPPGIRLVVRQPQTAAHAKLGDSIALDGCCLTVVAIDGDKLGFDAGAETLSRTTLGKLAPGDPVNIETSLRVGDEMGGHFVTGHIDAIGTIDARQDDAEWSTLRIRAPKRLMPQIASKGSIAVDGVSLTLVDVVADQFSVALIPHTLKVTTLGRRGIGDLVNLETDVLAKYVEKQMENRR
jgi:riboflavin synthase